MARPLRPLISSGGYYPSRRWIPLVRGNGYTTQDGGEEEPGIWKTIKGALIHITDALASPMQKCEVTLEPIQDLHGQDAPYPAGGGKNKFGENASPTDGYYLAASGAVSAATGWVVSDYIAVQPNTTYTFNPNSTEGASANHGYYTDEKVFISGIGSGARTFTTPANCYYMRFSYRDTSTNIQLELGSSATPYSPYSNICPITGWTGCEVNVANENLFDEVWELGTVNTSTGQNNPSNNDIRVKNYIPIKIGEPFYLGWDTAQTGSVYGLLDVYKADKSFSRYFGAFTNPRSFTLNADEAYIRFYLYGRTTPLVNAYIVYGTSSADYVPHQGTTLSVTFPDSTGTVYGGTLDVVTGELVVDRAEVDMGALTWFAGFSGYYTTDIASSVLIPSGIYNQGIISEMFPNDYGKNNVVFLQIADAYKGWLVVQTSQWGTANDFKIAVTGVKLVFPLATPLTYQLTPQEISTLSGENNVWSNTNGDTTIIYKAQSS